MKQRDKIEKQDMPPEDIKKMLHIACWAYADAAKKICEANAVLRMYGVIAGERDISLGLAEDGSKTLNMPLCKGIKELAAVLGAEVHYPRRCGGFDYSKLTCTYNGVRFTQAGQAQDTIKYDFF